jgi:hypothetical protein
VGAMNRNTRRAALLRFRRSDGDELRDP